jgi:site-specific recombinase XerD
MLLGLYRRHRRDCKSDHGEELRTSEYDERKKGWKRCECPIFVSGTLRGKFKRQNTGKWEWADARSVADTWEIAGSWSVQPTVLVSLPPEPPQRVTIADAIESFLTRCSNRGIVDATLKKYKTFVKQLRTYCNMCGYVFIDQLTVADMDRFYASWKDDKRSRAKKLERLKAFTKFCAKRDWIRKNIAEDLEAPKGSSIPVSKSPFTDKELDRIYATCDKIARTPSGPGRRDWSGEDVKDFVMLSIHTGLRISDVASFDINKRLSGNDVFLRMHKTQRELYTWIPDWLVLRLRAREREHGPLIFKSGESRVLRTMAELWRAKLKKVFKLAGTFEEKPTPHRFRHTFVRILLEKGVPIADVAELIGDAEQVVRKHYAKWVPERQARLSKILYEAFSRHAVPKTVDMFKVR